MSNLSSARNRRWPIVANALRSAALFALAVLTTSAASSSAAARETGLATEGCTGCHSGGSAPKVTITPSSSSVGLGQKITLTIAIEAINGGRAGLYFTTTQGVGTLSLVDSATKLSGSNGITHSAPKDKAASSNVVTFSVEWTAPSQPGDVELNAYALSANGDRRSTGDGGGGGFLSLAFGCAGTKYFRDRDGDGDGSPDVGYRMACSQPMYFSPTASDCDDNDERVHAGATELCNARDDDCDGMVDEGLTFASYCEDKDGDGHGVMSTNAKQACGVSKGFGLCDDDCNDADPTVYPMAQELCNERDDNCNGRADEEAKLSCGVGWCRRYGEGCSAAGPCTPGKPRAEECNGFDDDCDGVIDNGANLCGAGKSCLEGSCIVASSGDGGTNTSDAGEAGPAEAGSQGSSPGQVSDDEGRGASGGCSAAPAGSSEVPALLLLLGLLSGRRRHTRS